MKLDDRPVIDQLLEPTSLNILEEARGAAARELDEREAKFSIDLLGILREHVKELDLDLSAGTLDGLDSTLQNAADEVAEMYAEVEHESLSVLVDHLEARL